VSDRVVCARAGSNLGGDLLRFAVRRDGGFGGDQPDHRFADAVRGSEVPPRRCPRRPAADGDSNRSPPVDPGCGVRALPDITAVQGGGEGCITVCAGHADGSRSG
jgi:hypothetical protein